jgi:hypothetical protein
MRVKHSNLFVTAAEGQFMTNGSRRDEISATAQSATLPHHVELYEEFLDCQAQIISITQLKHQLHESVSLSFSMDQEIADKVDTIYERLYTLARLITGGPSRSALAIRAKAAVVLEFAEERPSDIVHLAGRDLAQSILAYLAESPPDELRYEVIR